MQEKYSFLQMRIKIVPVAILADLQAQSDIITSIDSWYPPFADYYRANFQAMDGVDNVNNLNFTLFSARLTQYLYSPSGAR